jgi:hypothetical protein
MKNRKTIEVKDIKETVNNYLVIKELTQDEKKAYCFLLEVILHKTNNYNGYYYITTYLDNQEYNRVYI